MSRLAEMCVDVAAVPDLTRSMRIVVYLAALLAVIGSTGCIWHKHQPPPPLTPIGATSKPVTNANTFIVTPEEGLHGRIASVNANLRFVVLTFPIGQMPAVDARLNVYRNGNKVAELKVTGPQREDNTVADVVSGDPIAGDEVRQE